MPDRSAAEAELNLSQVAGRYGCLPATHAQFTFGTLSTLSHSRSAFDGEGVSEGEVTHFVDHGTTFSFLNSAKSRRNISSLSSTSWKPQRRALFMSDITS